MAWFNPYGLVFVCILMIPNTVFALKCKSGFDNLWENKAVQALEQIGRFGCFALMFINLPGMCLGFISHGAFILYLAANSVLLLCYCAVWVVCFKLDSVFRALALSVIPSVMFIFSGLISRSFLLIAAALVFAPCHIAISYKNAAMQKR